MTEVLDVQRYLVEKVWRCDPWKRTATLLLLRSGELERK